MARNTVVTNMCDNRPRSPLHRVLKRLWSTDDEQEEPTAKILEEKKPEDVGIDQEEKTPEYVGIDQEEKTPEDVGIDQEEKTPEDVGSDQEEKKPEDVGSDQEEKTPEDVSSLCLDDQQQRLLDLLREDGNDSQVEMPIPKDLTPEELAEERERKMWLKCQAGVDYYRNLREQKEAAKAAEKAEVEAAKARVISDCMHQMELTVLGESNDIRMKGLTGVIGFDIRDVLESNEEVGLRLDEYVANAKHVYIGSTKSNLVARRWTGGPGLKDGHHKLWGWGKDGLRGRMDVVGLRRGFPDKDGCRREESRYKAELMPLEEYLIKRFKASYPTKILNKAEDTRGIGADSLVFIYICHAE